jgi:tetratricopeptide (TPR) repeat protein
MAQLLQAIEGLLRDEADPQRRAVLLAKKAIYLARSGQFQSAQTITAELRSNFGSGQSAQVTAWIMLLEGIRLLYEEISPNAIDRVRRAQFLAMAIKDRPLISLSSAWKAHLEFERSDFPEMAKSLRTSIDSATDADHDAIARHAMVLADVHFLCGDRVQAQNWFMRSRSHAVKSGDQATTEALLYNRAAFGTAWLRAERCFSVGESSDLTLTRLEVASARNFQDMTKISAFSHLISLCEARLLILEAEFERAIGALRIVRDQGPFANYNFSQEIIDLEISYCQKQLGRTDEASMTYDRIRDADFADMDVDDRLVVAWLRSEITKNSPEFGDHETESRKLEAMRHEYSASRRAIQDLLTQFKQE